MLICNRSIYLAPPAVDHCFHNDLYGKPSGGCVLHSLMGVSPPVLTRRPFDGKYHYLQTCHRHTGGNPIVTTLNSRKCVHAAWLVSLINVPDDLHIHLLMFSEGFSGFPNVPSLSKELECLFFYPPSKKISKKYLGTKKSPRFN